MKPSHSTRFKSIGGTSNRKPSAPKLRPRPPSTFGREDTDHHELGETVQNLSKMNIYEQRKISKKYLDDKLKEIKVKYRSQAEIASRFMELIKIVRINESSLNIDSLTG